MQTPSLSVCSPTAVRVFKLLLQKLSVPIALVGISDSLDIDSPFLMYINDESQKLLFDRNHLGKRTIDLFGREESKLHRQMQCEVSRTGQKKFLSDALFQNASFEGYYDFFIKNVPGYKHPVVLISFRDVTKAYKLRKAKQERAHAQASIKIKKRFLSYLLYEMRAPLCSIHFLLQFILSNFAQNQAPSQVAHLNQSIACAIQADKMLSRILDFARAEANQLAIDNSEFNISDCLKQAVQTISAGALAKGLNVHSLVQNDQIVITDRKILTQILLLILDNALQFTQSGSITISCFYAYEQLVLINPNNLYDEEPEVPPEHEPVECVHICISDTGLGIPKAFLEQIFLPFNQIGPKSGFGGGAGFGLALCRILCFRLGGKVWCESNGVGHGSTFHVVLPVCALPVHASRKRLVK